MDIVKRRLVTEPGDDLLLARAAVLPDFRREEFASASGISSADLLSSALTAHPVPDYRSIPDGARRWAGTSPAIMWHPLMWLPDSVAGRYQTPAEDGTIAIEPDDWHQLRVMLTLKASPLYDQENGTWVDVLALFGLDIALPETQARVAAWLAGGDDDLLDVIDLANYLRVAEDPHWAFTAAGDLLPQLTQASWAFMANDLLGVSIMPVTAGAITELADARNTVSVATGIAYLYMRGLPTDGVHEYLSQLLKLIDSASEITTVQAIAANLEEFLTGVRDSYWPFLEALEEMDPAATDSQTATTGGTL